MYIIRSLIYIGIQLIGKSKFFNRHIMSVYEGVDGLRCNFEQCSVACQRLSKIKEHIIETHSVKNPVFGNLFSDEYNTKHTLGDDMFNDKEIDLAHIYEGPGIQIDNDVLGKSANEKLKIKIVGKKNRNVSEDNTEQFE